MYGIRNGSASMVVAPRAPSGQPGETMSDTPPPSPAPLPSSWNDEGQEVERSDRKSRIWWIIGALAIIVVVVVGAFVVVRSRDQERAWPAATSGRPAGLGGEKQTTAEVDATAPPGVYIWQSFDGWHLWIVNGEGLEGLSGTIKSSAKLVNASASAPEDGTVGITGKTVEFDLDGGNAVAGVDFDPGFSDKLTFTLESGGVEVKASQVFTGSESAAVDAVPVVIDKPVVE